MTLHLPRKSATPTQSPYQKLGLKDLPFPTEPVVDPYSTDDRKNGAIYAASIVEEKVDKFERLLIRPTDFLNRVRLAYLWAKGDRESGRGMGKTALLRYFRQRINRDWGQTEFDGQFSAAVIYVSFPSQVDRRYMEQLALAALVDVCKNGVLPASRAALRLQVLTPEQAEAILKHPDGTENPANLLNDEVFQARGIIPASIDETVAKLLVQQGVQANAATALADGEFEQHLRSFRKDGNLVPYYIPRDTRILDYSRGLLFNDVVLYLRAAGFAGGYLFIDDIENLVDQMTRRERIEFAKEFGLCTVRPGYANTTHNFFSCVLTTHQQASVGLSQAWGDAGLSAIARLDPSSANSIELPLPSKDQAKEIVIAHLDHYRMNTDEMRTIKPFTADGMDGLLKDQQNTHPRILLGAAAKVMHHAVETGCTMIDGECVKAGLAAEAGSTSITAPDMTEGIENAL